MIPTSALFVVTPLFSTAVAPNRAPSCTATPLDLRGILPAAPFPVNNILQLINAIETRKSRIEKKKKLFFLLYL